MDESEPILDSDVAVYKHLIGVAFSAPNSNQLPFSLKNFYLSQCLERSTYTHKLPENIFGSKVRCSNCCSSWTEQKYSYKIQRKLRAKKKKKCKAIIKNASGKSTASEINMAKKLLNGMKVIIKCSLCEAITTEIIPKNKPYIRFPSSKPKPARASTSSASNQQTQTTTTAQSIQLMQLNISSQLKAKPQPNPVKVPVEAIEKISATRKKKNKDKFAGLCEVACKATKNMSNEINDPVKRNTGLDLLLKST